MELRYFATTNEHKLKEVSHILGYGLEKVHLELTEPQDMSVENIAKTKALEAFEKVGQPVLVEDTGWYFEAWNGLPGAFAKFFMDTVGCQGILKMMANENNRRARVKTAVAYHDGKEVHLFVGELLGTVVAEERGDSKFGFDRIFQPNGQTKTYGEMSLEEKNAISHRSLAVTQLKHFLDARSN